ncbi:MAG: hypothetical protein KC549_14905, partial [Myxococcales bacterium]|nr:hypothetical protein [Myxococcales bacterium]
LATPVVEGHRATRFGPLMARLGVDLDAAAARIHARGAVPVPVTGFYSRRDAVVAWQACLDPHPGARFTPVEVAAGHLAMVLDPRVLRLVARHL